MHKPTSASTAGKHGYGTPAANSPSISRPVGPKCGLAARAKTRTRTHRSGSPRGNYGVQTTPPATITHRTPQILTTTSTPPWPAGVLATLPLLRKPSLHIPTPNATSQHHSPILPRPRRRRCRVPLRASWRPRHPSHLAGHSTFAVEPRGVRTHFCQCHSHSSAVGFVGRYSPSPLQQDAGRNMPKPLHQLQHPTEAPPAGQAALTAANDLQKHGFAMPDWEALTTGTTQSPPQPSRDGPTHHRGWQHGAVHAYHTSFEASLQPRLDPANQALLATQQGPHASRSFTTIPCNIDAQYPTHLFRTPVLGRLHLPIPPHSSSLPVPSHFWYLWRPSRNVRAIRDSPNPQYTSLERAAARMCREAGARVTTNTLLTDLNLDHIHRQHDRRIEVIANRLPIWGGCPASSWHHHSFVPHQR